MFAANVQKKIIQSVTGYRSSALQWLLGIGHTFSREQHYIFYMTAICLLHHSSSELLSLDSACCCSYIFRPQWVYYF